MNRNIHLFLIASVLVLGALIFMRLLFALLGV